MRIPWSSSPGASIHHLHIHRQGGSSLFPFLVVDAGLILLCNCSVFFSHQPVSCDFVLFLWYAQIESNSSVSPQWDYDTLLLFGRHISHSYYVLVGEFIVVAYFLSLFMISRNPEWALYIHATHKNISSPHSEKVTLLAIDVKYQLKLRGQSYAARKISPAHLSCTQRLPLDSCT